VGTEQGPGPVQPEVPGRALAIYAHPDDPDVSCGGTLARWAASGCQVHVCICCDGDKGSLDPAVDNQDLVRVRKAEVEAAGRLLGVAEHYWLGYGDGEIDNSPPFSQSLVGLVRRLRPDAVLAPDPTAVFFGPNYVNHRDHRVVGWATLDAVSPAAANPHYFPGEGPPFQVPALYLSGTLEPDTWIDITSVLDVKAAALACHASQLGEGGEWLRSVVRQQAEGAGQLAGVPFAEAFRKVVLG
jgi:LmbE family N-acetylglucosaminyl deacetylase